MDENQEVIKSQLHDEVLLQENRNLMTVQRALENALAKVFGEQTESQRFVDTKRIPLICKDISNILKTQEELKASTLKVADELRLNTEKIATDLRNVLEKKDNDYEIRLRRLETFKNQMDGKADKNSVWLAYVFSIIGLIVGIILHFWR